MGSVRRQEGERIENAKAARFRLRKDAAMMREAFFVRLYASGERMADIAEKMRAEFGSCSLAHLYEMRDRALARLAEQLDAQTREQARALYVYRMEMVAAALVPRALGTAFDPETMAESTQPDVRAAELLVRVWEKVAEATGGKERERRPAVNLNVFNLPDNPDQAREAILAGLAAEAQKLRTVEGHLVAAGSTLHALTEGEEPDDRMPSPVTEIELPAAPQERDS